VSPRRHLDAGWSVLVTLGRNITRHHTMLIAGGVAFSCVLGLVPALIAIVAVYGLVASPSDVESNLEPLVEALPAEASELLIEQLKNVTAVSDTQITVGLVIGLAGVAWAVSNILNSIVMGIRIAHEIPSPHTWVRGRIFALKLSLVAVLATATMIWFVVALPRVLDRADLGGATRWAISIGRWPLVAVISATALALLYRIVAGHRTGRYHAVSSGAVVGTAAWMLSTYGLSFAYDHIGELESTFGSLGAVAVLMVWFYLSVLSALVGAEVDGLLHRGIPADGATPDLEDAPEDNPEDIPEDHEMPPHDGADAAEDG
jgi:membrane protein